MTKPRMEQYVAKMSFTIGETGQVVEQGSEIKFDGVNCSINGAAPVNIPRLSTCITAGWIAKVGDDTPFKPTSANIVVSPSTPTSQRDGKFNTVTAEVDEQVVGNFRDRAALRNPKGTLNTLKGTEGGVRTVVQKMKSPNVGPEGTVTNRTLVSKENVTTVTQKIRELDPVQGQNTPRKVTRDSEGIRFTTEGVSAEAGDGKEPNAETMSQRISTAETDGVVVSTVKQRGRPPKAAQKTDMVDSQVTVSAPKRRGRPPKSDKKVTESAPRKIQFSRQSA